MEKRRIYRNNINVSTSTIIKEENFKEDFKEENNDSMFITENT